MGIGFTTGSVSADMNLVANGTLATQNANVDITYSFDVTKRYVIVFRFEQQTANGNISIYGNTDTTATNYYSQQLHANNTTISGGRYNAAYCGNGINAQVTGIIVDLWIDSDTKLCTIAKENFADASGIRYGVFANKSTGNFATLTKIRFNNSQANGFKAGATYEVWEYNAS